MKFDDSRFGDLQSSQEASQVCPKEKTYEQKLRRMSTSELISELAIVKWHYTLFKDKKKFDMICAIELEIARRKGRLEPSRSNGVER